MPSRVITGMGGVTLSVLTSQLLFRKVHAGWNSGINRRIITRFKTKKMHLNQPLQAFQVQRYGRLCAEFICCLGAVPGTELRRG